MSIKVICDKCGRVTEESVEKEMPDLEIFMDGDEPIYTAEDLCDECRSAIRRVIMEEIAAPLKKQPRETAPNGRLEDETYKYPSRKKTTLRMDDDNERA